MSPDPKSKIPAHLKVDIEREIERNKKHFIEISLLLGEENFAKNVAQITKLDFDWKKFSEAAHSLTDGNFAQAIEICSSSIIRQEAIDRLFKTNQTKEAIQLLKQEDIEIAKDHLASIINEHLADELLEKIGGENEGDGIFSFF